MNAQRSDNELDLGTEFQIDLESLAYRQTSYTVQQLITALETMTTLAELSLRINGFEPRTGNNQRAIVEPLCHCIANLHLQNEYHPLSSLAFDYTGDLIRKGLLDVFQQFLTAAKRYGMYRLKLFGTHELPMQVLVDFCRGNSALRDLDMSSVTFTGRGTAVDWSQYSTFLLALDTLSLDDIGFCNNSAATEFADLVARMNFFALELGRVDTTDSRGNSCDCMLELFKSPPQQLTLKGNCELQHFQATLKAGVGSVTNLTVFFSDKSDTYAKMDLLASMIRGAVQLRTLAIENNSDTHTRICRFNPPPQLIQAIEACATVTWIELNNYGDRNDFDLDQVQQLRNVRARNNELARFIENPCMYPTESLMALLCQFDNCPTGRYMLARRLPEHFSFEKRGKGMKGQATEPNQKKRKSK